MTVAAVRGTTQIPETEGSVPASTQKTLDAALDTLKSHKGGWLEVGVPERLAILGQLTKDTARVAEGWVTAALEAKGIVPGAREESEEWMGGPLSVLRNLRLLRRSLADIQASGRPQVPGPVRVRADGRDGQVVAPVLPLDAFDRIFYSGFSAEVWMEPGVTAEELPQTQALSYHQDDPEGKLALVLGAGNVSSIPPMDALYKLFVENQVVLVKMNPVNAYVGPYLEEAFQILIHGGFLQVVYGGGEEGAYLCHHPDVDEIHITGSDKTHDAIVYGGGPESAQRKAQGNPLLTKRITSELGNVSPVIVVPGPWSQGDLSFQAANLVSMLTNNAGFNCNATRVIIQRKGWDQRSQLLDAVRSLLERVPTRKAYYPGAAQRFETFVSSHPQAQVGERSGEEVDSLPWAFIPRLDPEARQDVCFTTEAFCGVFGETALEADSLPEYLDRAVDFANESLWGTLNVSLLVHPASLKDPEVKAAVDRAVANLRYGTVAVNHWAALGYVFGSTTWGAFPGHPLDDIQSGRGVVHNTLMFSRPQKTVVRGPFRVRPTPPWFVTHRGSAALARKLTYFEAKPTWGKVPGILWSALKG